MRKIVILLVAVLLSVSSTASAEQKLSSLYVKDRVLTSVKADTVLAYQEIIKAIETAGWKRQETEYHPEVSCGITIINGEVAGSCEQPYWPEVAVRDYAEKTSEAPAMLDRLIKKYKKASAALEEEKDESFTKNGEILHLRAEAADNFFSLTVDVLEKDGWTILPGTGLPDNAKSDSWCEAKVQAQGAEKTLYVAFLKCYSPHQGRGVSIKNEVHDPKEVSDAIDKLRKEHRKAAKALRIN